LENITLTRSKFGLNETFDTIQAVVGVGGIIGLKSYLENLCLWRIMKSLRVIGALLLASASIVTASAANAAAKITVDLPNDAVAAGVVAQIPVTVTGLTWAKADVTLTSADGDLTVADPTSLLTLQPGYPSLTGTSLSFYGNSADVSSILKTGLSWTSPQTAATNVLKFKLSISEHVDNQVVDPGSGHSYRYVSDSGIHWVEARTAANQLTVLGHVGYLVNITSSDENSFVATKTNAQNVWIGATSDDTILAAAQAPITGDVHHCAYYWASGATDFGHPVSTTCGNPVAVNGSYSAWASGEPNNSGGTEACGVDNWQGSAGSWNDLNCTSGAANGYLVEFDTSASDFTGHALVYNDLNGDAVDAIPALANTGSNSLRGLELGSLLSVVGLALVLFARRKQSKN
jgi:hypothetical protein